MPKSTMPAAWVACAALLGTTALSGHAIAQTLSVGALQVAIDPATQTLQQLSPTTNTAFGFLPTDANVTRDGPGYVHVGDIHLRVRVGSGAWHDFASDLPAAPIAVLPPSGNVLASADITASLGSTLPLQVVRSWVNVNNTLALQFAITNPTAQSVEIGVLGMPMAFDSVLTNRNIQQNTAQAVFADPYIGRDAGYLQVTPLSGTAAPLLVLPEPGTPFEAYAPILQNTAVPPGYVFTDATQISQTFEGFYDWTVASLGFAQNEWQGVQRQWNQPTSIMLAPGATRTFGLRFVLSPTIRAINDTLAAQARPVTIAVPGYVAPPDMDNALYIKAPSAITGTMVEPAGALSVVQDGSVGGYVRLRVRGQSWGRARLTVYYADGEAQTVSYYVTKPLEQATADLGHFTTTKQWFRGVGDPFGRTPAILSYDRQANAIVSQEPRVWIAGMSDEGGSGSWVAAAMKQLDNPNPIEVARLERLINQTVANALQIQSGPQQGAVLKSLFYYEPTIFPDYYSANYNWLNWWSWNLPAAHGTDRPYDYPHVTIGYWVMYRLARNHVGLVTAHPWQWYLQHAYQTVIGMATNAQFFTQVGLMEGDVFVSLLDDLKSEPTFANQAAVMEEIMQARAKAWSQEVDPFGSEMAWDSTGQEEVYAWEKYYGYRQQAQTTLNSILGYDPDVPGWGYNGNARRYWDFIYAGKIQGIERQIYHYGAALNALPLFDKFRSNPKDVFLLRVAYGGFMGGITNIDQQGFGACAFHSLPYLMEWDPYTGDYGTGFFGHAYAAATYVVNDPDLGWLAYGGNLASGSGGSLTVQPKDGARTQLFVGPAGAWIQLQAGKIASASVSTSGGAVTLTLDPADYWTPAARIFVSHTTDPAHPLTVTGGILERGGYTVKLGPGQTTVQIAQQ